MRRLAAEKAAGTLHLPDELNEMLFVAFSKMKFMYSLDMLVWGR
jgi:hypothetical protein